jgi:hypothetical protein
VKVVVVSIGEAVVAVSIGEAVVVSIGEAVVVSIGEAVVVSIGEAVVVVEPIAKLTLNRRLGIGPLTPEKPFIVLLMSVLGTEVLEAINPGDETVPD